MTGNYRVDHIGGPCAGTEIHFASTEAEADALATDLVRLHGGRAVAWCWRDGLEGSETSPSMPQNGSEGSSGPRVRREAARPSESNERALG